MTTLYPSEIKYNKAKWAEISGSPERIAAYRAKQREYYKKRRLNAIRKSTNK